MEWRGGGGGGEFENTEGEEYQADPSSLASPGSQNGPEVYVLPLTQVSLPVSQQPGRSGEDPPVTNTDTAVLQGPGGASLQALRLSRPWVE
ncbi:hypothetical protein COCON_G00207340 [Conger conger]|uniref:Uncharacterized protein n=1 Tax=Conger conger TaxID=82655 RepID=A0A9Q1HPN0_CONCO|nr:hypothetical protein COCON_G00207340 [Conger conger]